MAEFIVWEPAAPRPAQVVAADTPRDAAEAFGRSQFSSEYVADVWVTDSDGRTTRWTVSAELTRTVRAQLLFEAPP